MLTAVAAKTSRTKTSGDLIRLLTDAAQSVFARPFRMEYWCSINKTKSPLFNDAYIDRVLIKDGWRRIATSNNKTLSVWVNDKSLRIIAKMNDIDSCEFCYEQYTCSRVYRDSVVLYEDDRRVSLMDTTRKFPRVRTHISNDDIRKETVRICELVDERRAKDKQRVR